MKFIIQYHYLNFINKIQGVHHYCDFKDPKILYLKQLENSQLLRRF